MKKVVLISGGSDGIGKELASKLSNDFQVVILSRNQEKTEMVAKTLGVDFVVADVSNFTQTKTAVDEVLKKYGAVDVLVNNAGVWLVGLLEQNDEADIQKVIEVNVLGTIFLTKAVLPYMKDNGRGRIVNVISQSGLYGKSETSIYNAAKWAITGFTKSLEMEVSSCGISVSGFYPAGIKTGFFEKQNHKKDLSKYLEIKDVVDALEFIIKAPDSVNIPELGIKKL